LFVLSDVGLAGAVRAWNWCRHTSAFCGFPVALHSATNRSIASAAALLRLNCRYRAGKWLGFGAALLRDQVRGQAFEGGGRAPREAVAPLLPRTASLSE
jgi:hypothetical protein